MGSIDSELFARWKTNQKELRKFGRRSSPAAQQRLEELQREKNLIEIDWIELFAQKQRGVLTDRTRVDLAIKTAKEVSLLYGFPLRFHEEEGSRDEDHLPNFWFL